MKLKYSLICFLLAFAFTNSGICSSVVEDQEIENEFIEIESEKIKKEQEQYLSEFPWTKDDQFKNSPSLIYGILLKIKLHGSDDNISRILESNPVLNESEINFVIAIHVIYSMESRNINLEQALEEVRRDINSGKINIKSIENIEQRYKDAKIFIKMANVEELIKNIKSEELNRQLAEFAKTRTGAEKETGVALDILQEKHPKTSTTEENSVPKTVDYTKPLSMEQLSIKYGIQLTDAKSKQVALYGIYSTRENYASGYYKNQKGEFSPLPKVQRAKNPWEILGIEEMRDIGALTEATKSKLSAIPAKYKTEIKLFKGTCQDAIIEYAKDGNKVAIVSFANGKTVGGGSLHGKIGQEESLIHCIAGLYESLLMNSDQPQNSGNLASYKDVWNSPEMILYTENATLIKRCQRGSFLAANSPVSVNVISSAAINLDPSYGGFGQNWLVQETGMQNSDPYSEIRRRICMQVAIAILTGNEILITGFFGCGRYQADKSQIAKIYKEVLSNPLFDGELEVVVFASGGFEP